MQMNQADFVGDMDALTPKRERTDQPIEAAEQRLCIRLSIEQICDGTWSIGCKPMGRVAGYVPAGSE